MMPGGQVPLAGWPSDDDDDNWGFITWRLMHCYYGCYDWEDQNGDTVMITMIIMCSQASKG